MNKQKLKELVDLAMLDFEQSSLDVDVILERTVKQTSYETLRAALFAVQTLQGLSADLQASSSRRPNYPGLKPDESARWEGRVHAYEAIARILEEWCLSLK